MVSFLNGLKSYIFLKRIKTGAYAKLDTAIRTFNHVKPIASTISPANIGPIDHLHLPNIKMIMEIEQRVSTFFNVINNLHISAKQIFNNKMVILPKLLYASPVWCYNSRSK